MHCAILEKKVSARRRHPRTIAHNGSTAGFRQRREATRNLEAAYTLKAARVTRGLVRASSLQPH